MDHTPHAIIIGSGVAGLATAIRLASAGLRVDVYESNAGPGGKLTLFEQDGYRFDAGPSLFTQPENIAELFALAGEPMDAYFRYVQAEVVCHYFFPGGQRLRTYAEREALLREFQEQLGEDPRTVARYLDRAEALYNDVGRIFLHHSLHKSSTWLHPRVLRAFRSLRRSYLTRTLNRYHETHFRTPEAVQLFNRFATYNGSNPYRAPAMLSLIPHLEQNQGTFYPAGGMISITRALHKLAEKKGVVFHFGRRVDRIWHAYGRVCGIVTEGEKRPAERVISNADVYHTYGRLLDMPRKAARIDRQERSSSALIFYWGVRRSFPELGLHNIFFTSDYKAEFGHLFDTYTLYDDPTIYINITSKMEAGHAPEGSENWFVMINAPARHEQSWPELVERARRIIRAKLERMLGVSLEGLIDTEIVMDPPGIERLTDTYRGSLYGTSSNSRMAAFFRPPNFSSELKGLYFCGGTVHPGGGIPLCLRSAAITSDLILQEHART